MKKSILFLAMLITCFNVQAANNCFGTDNMYTCTDPQTGNTYNVNKFGNTTQVQANNSRTGASWSQSTQNYGGQSNTTGRDKDGNVWQHNTNQVGNTQHYNGNNSNGGYYNGSCNPYTGCQTNKIR